jgi:hypothetical protein
MVSDRFVVGFSRPAMARPSSSESIHRGRVPTGRRGSGRLDFVLAYRHHGGSAFGRLGTSMMAATHRERRNRWYPASESRPPMEQLFGRVTTEKSRAFCGRGVLFSSVEVSHREAAGDLDARHARSPAPEIYWQAPCPVALHDPVKFEPPPPRGPWISDF